MALALTAAETGLRPVAGVRFTLNPERRVAYAMYQPHIHVRLHWLEFDPPVNQGNPVTVADPILSNLRILARGGRGNFLPPFGMFIAHPTNGKLVLFAHAPNSLARGVPPGAARLILAFGMKPNAYYDSSGGDGVGFVVRGVRQDGGEDVLFNRYLDPKHREADRGEQTAEIGIPVGKYVSMIFETNVGPAENSAWDQSYWSRADIE